MNIIKKKNKLEKEIIQQDQLKLKQNKFDSDLVNIDKKIEKISDIANNISGNSSILSKSKQQIKQEINSLIKNFKYK